MRYHTDIPDFYVPIYGSVYYCDHLVYNKCTLFKIGDRGLAVIQQKYNPVSKNTWWTRVDPWIANAIYIHPKFYEYFNERAGECRDGLYPTVTVRQLMWSLKMKPLKRERWETCFDHRDI